ncbi:phosphoglucomutase (alpha-D-glucose-1,6-bisphosphate-dependent) [Lysobacter sp. A03]|uniref:phosphoglucomutase (alpha-D-glucose-1,6-bisphosphate-dependent) n=1 Tax=Lysobacter sp. A03 TaxID=1199154 RepID=UPI0005B70B90|nr:phosphoglucomutase (alpha-D-glucose-1,6-bisphosphate-dependent) [Lysobacter sp. A03]KIQ96540.1 Phosphoglucomutase [Lysobacter sp. A03]
MGTRIDKRAGTLAEARDLIDVGHLVNAYFQTRPDASNPAQSVSFGTSGHRGSSLEGSFNEDHILAITQAICAYRKGQGIDGPIFIGADTHALSAPALETALEVLAANGVQVHVSADDEPVPTPAISHAILVHNSGRERGLADGIVITPSHNPPADGGFKYNPPNGGPADTDVTGWIQKHANASLANGLADVRRWTGTRARAADTTREHDFLSAYVADLGNVVDFDLIRSADLRLGVDPLGGAGVHYWARIAEHYRIALDVVSEQVDPQFGFMSLDWDGRIRMDPSSPYAMSRLIGLKDRYDVAFACDTDHDRHGIVTASAGLMPSNHYLSVAIDYLFRNRPQWSAKAGIGKTVVSSAMIDRIAAGLGRHLVEVPVGFKWFVDGLFSGTLGFGGEESAGASFLRRDGSVWTTDKDGIAPALLAAEMSARGGNDPGEIYRRLCDRYGEPFTDRVEAPATKAQKRALAGLTPEAITRTELAGEPIQQVLDKAPGNDASIGGIKIVAASGWFAARPSGTEDIYKIYAESFRDADHLQQLLKDAQETVDAALEDPSTEQ